MKTGDKIDLQAFEKGHRPFDTMQDLVNAIRPNQIVWSWGAEAWTKMSQYCLRFKVNGHHHKGHVYLVVNGMDLFDVYLTTTKGTIKEIVKNVYVGDLLQVIDKYVEYIPEYQF